MYNYEFDIMVYRVFKNTEDLYRRSKMIYSYLYIAMTYPAGDLRNKTQAHHAPLEKTVSYLAKYKDFVFLLRWMK